MRMTIRVAGVTATDAMQHHGVGVSGYEKRASQRGDGGEREDDLA
jgi:hypothetical protein